MGRFVLIRLLHFLCRLMHNRFANVTEPAHNPAMRYVEIDTARGASPSVSRQKAMVCCGLRGTLDAAVFIVRSGFLLFFKYCCFQSDAKSEPKLFA